MAAPVRAVKWRIRDQNRAFMSQAAEKSVDCRYQPPTWQTWGVARVPRRAGCRGRQWRQNPPCAIADDLDRHRATLLLTEPQGPRRRRRQGLDDALLDRLELNDARIDSMIEGLRQVATLPDPIGGSST